MFETYQMLGAQREADLLRDADRLRAGAKVRRRVGAERRRPRFARLRLRLQRPAAAERAVVAAEDR